MQRNIASRRSESLVATLFGLIFSFCCLSFSSFVSATPFKSIDWVDLIPEQDLEVLLNPPESLLAIPDGSALDFIPDDPFADAVEQAIDASVKPLTPEEQTYYAALKSTKINDELGNQKIRLPGFVVPVEYGDNQVITEFFLVPYFGACIHVPPPPPNQIIYVKYPQGLTVDALYDPFWIEGELLTELVENDLAVSAYSMNAENIEIYQEYEK